MLDQAFQALADPIRATVPADDVQLAAAGLPDARAQSAVLNQVLGIVNSRL